MFLSVRIWLVNFRKICTVILISAKKVEIYLKMVEYAQF
jgi:hypothetical protein